MILAAIALFSLTAVLGLLLIVLGVRYRRGSLPMAAGHVVAALIGLGVLFKVILGGPRNMLYNNAALLFVLTLIGALILLALRVSAREYRTPPPMFMVGLHAVLALAGLLLLVMGYTRA
jgi:hypothetical protein